MDLERECLHTLLPINIKKKIVSSLDVGGYAQSQKLIMYWYQAFEVNEDLNYFQKAIAYNSPS